MVYFFSLFFTFLLILSFFKDILRQVSAVFPAMIYVWFRCFKENISKVLDTLVFSKFVPTYRCTNKNNYSTAVDMSRNLFFECKTLFRFRDAGMGVHYGGTSPLPFERRWKEGTGALTYQYHKQFHDSSRSVWNKFIATIRAHLKFRMVFYNFCY